MKTRSLSTQSFFALCFFSFAAYLPVSAGQSDPINILVIGAHPDDADLCAGGSAIYWSQLGHRVKFLSLTNGDAGHQSQGGGALARRRRAEAQVVAQRLGIQEYEVLDNHDGELFATLDVRLQVIRRIRSWDADVVILPRPNDYHPDHRHTGLVVQDAAYMVIVPNVAPDTPPLTKNPVFLYCQDRFQKPNPFDPEISVDITPVFKQKISGLDAHTSQFYEWLPWTSQAVDQVPISQDERKVWLEANWSRPPTPAQKNNLSAWYGPAHLPSIRQAESFEICEYGRQPGPEEIVSLFPMLQRPDRLECPSFTEKIRIDGELNEHIYAQLPRQSLWNSLSGQAVSDSSYRTYFYIFRDEDHLYVSFKCYDRDIYSTYTKRDQHLWNEEVVEVFIDTDDDPNTYFEIEVSPAGVLFDSYITDPNQIDLDETPKFNFSKLKYKVQVEGSLKNRNDTDKYWTVEMAIPLNELSETQTTSPNLNSPWKINLYRINTDASPIKYQAWRPTFGSFHKPHWFSLLDFK